MPLSNGRPAEGVQSNGAVGCVARSRAHRGDPALPAADVVCEQERAEGKHKGENGQCDSQRSHVAASQVRRASNSSLAASAIAIAMASAASQNGKRVAEEVVRSPGSGA